MLLHGQPGSAADWDQVVAALNDRVRLVVPDRPGYGDNAVPAAGFAANSDAVIAALDAAGVECAVVVGYSWAGGVALDLAQRYAGRVRGLVLVAAVGAAGSVDPFDRALAAPVVGPAIVLTAMSVLGSERIRRVLVPSAMPLVPRSSWRSFLVEQRALTEELPAITARLGAVSSPAIVVIGEADVVVRPRVQEALAASLPGAEVVRVPGCGHLLPWEAPQAIADAIVRATGR